MSAEREGGRGCAQGLPQPQGTLR